MTNASGSDAAANLFSFAVKARLMLVGRQRLRHERKKLQFVLLTTDLSANSRREMLKAVNPVPVVECFTAAEVERLLHLKGAKIVGFRQSPLSRSILERLAEFVVETDATLPPPPPESESTNPSLGGDAHSAARR